MWKIENHAWRHETTAYENLFICNWLNYYYTSLFSESRHVILPIFLKDIVGKWVRVKTIDDIPT